MDFGKEKQRSGDEREKVARTLGELKQEPHIMEVVEGKNIDESQYVVSDELSPFVQEVVNDLLSNSIRFSNSFAVIDDFQMHADRVAWLREQGLGGFSMGNKMRLNAILSVVGEVNVLMRMLRLQHDLSDPELTQTVERYFSAFNDRYDWNGMSPVWYDSMTPREKLSFVTELEDLSFDMINALIERGYVTGEPLKKNEVSTEG